MNSTESSNGKPFAFGLANLMAMTLAFAILTVVLQFFSYPFNLIIIGLCGAVLVFQVFIFKQQRARLVSTLTGFSYVLLLTAVQTTAWQSKFGGHYDVSSFLIDVVSCLYWSVLLGVPLGYISGIVISGISPFAKRLRSW